MSKGVSWWVLSEWVGEQLVGECEWGYGGVKE